MRVLGWVMFAATCVLFALQGFFLGGFDLPDDLLRGPGGSGYSRCWGSARWSAPASGR